MIENPAIAFQQHIAGFGYSLAESPIGDGEIHRFQVGQKKNNDGWYILHDGEFPVGVFGDWKNGNKHKWAKKPQGAMTTQEREEYRAKVAESQRKQAEAREKAQQRAADQARKIWDEAGPANNHPYLSKKGIKPFETIGIRERNGQLIVPVRAPDGQIISLQRVLPNGTKRFLKDGKVRGGCFSIKGSGRLFLCEGFATGATIHEATGGTVIVAFNAGNLLPVAEAVRKKHPHDDITICADDDQWTDGNPGATKARVAAEKIQAKFVIPRFKDVSIGPTDFNDLHVLEGLDVVQAQLKEGDGGLEAPGPASGDELTHRLNGMAEMGSVDRELERKRISDEFNVRLSFIDGWISQTDKAKDTDGTTEIVTEVEPASEPVNGDALLSSIKGELLKYVILPGGVAEPIAAWVVLTYCYNAFRILPLLGIVSPVKRCGKTTLLEILQGMANKGLTASNISPAAIYRTIEKYSPTLLVDEGDTFLKDNEELRGILNSGHTRAGAFVVRVQGDDHEPVRFSTWAPKAVAMIGTLPDTLHDRSVIVSLRRKAPGETASKLDVDFEKECLGIRRACKRWADDNFKKLAAAKPDIPKTNNDRMADNWMPLLAIADAAGGDWPGLLRKSMLGMADQSDESNGPKLLSDIQGIFESQVRDRIFSDDLVEALQGIKESPWADWGRGRGLSPNGLAKQLKPFDVRSKTIRINKDRRKGYELSSFNDAFKRYIPLTPPISTVTTGQVNNISNLGQKQSVTKNNDVTDGKQRNLLKLHDCHGVTVEKGGMGEGNRKIEKCHGCGAHSALGQQLYCLG